MSEGLSQGPIGKKTLVDIFEFDSRGSENKSDI